MIRKLPLSKDGLLNFLERPLVSLSMWIILPLLFVFIFGDELSDIYRATPALGISYALIVAALVAVHWESVRSMLRPGSPIRWKLRWGWAMVGLAVLLRYALLEFLPVAVPINGEEIQMGGASIRIAEGGDLPISYRFTAIMGAVGFMALDNSLNGLRLVFELAGGLSIIVLALTLRRLSVGWPAVLLAVFTMSSLSLLVVGSGVAYENLSGVFFEVMLLYCVVCAVTSRANAQIWAGFAGVFGGILMHEFDSYKTIVIIPPILWFAQAALAGDVERRRRALRSGAVYIILLTIIGAAAFADLVNNPTTTSLLDGARRHTYERGMASPDIVQYLQNSLKLTWNYTQVLFGQNAQMAPRIFRMDNGPVIPLIPGALFALSTLYALVGKVDLFPRLAASIVLLMPVAVGFLTNNFTLERVVPALPVLVLLTGIGVDSLMKRLQAMHKPSYTLRKNPAVYCAILTGLIVTINIVGIAGMSSSEPVLREYQNNQYLICMAISDGHREFGFDHVQVLGHGSCNKGDDLWLYPDMAADIHRIDALPGELGIESGTLVVVADVHGLDDDELADITDRAWLVHSNHTLRSKYNLLGHVATMTFCYQCRSKAEPR